MSVVRNTLGKEQVPQDLGRPVYDEALREYRDKNYHQILPIIAKKVDQKKSGTLSRRRDLKERLGSRHARSMSESPKPRRGRSKSPKERGPERKTVFKRLEKGVFHRLGDKEKNPFAPQIRYFNFPKTQMPSHIKTYDGSEDPEDYLKIFQPAAKIERWAMPTWCHMFNSTLTGNARVWFDDLPQKSIDSYDDLKKAFLENYLQ
ncbi:reverse transcriptase domain-containing protein [Tanacetum coccineum]